MGAVVAALGQKQYGEPSSEATAVATAVIAHLRKHEH
jgi:hypothetical protein